ncbi:hypothetical protein ACWD9K_35590 [Streptomyces sp. 900116325]
MSTLRHNFYGRWLDDAGAAIDRRHHAEKLAGQYLHDVIGQASRPE